MTQECDFLLLDEILGVMEQGIVSVETVADILRQKDESMQIVMTGSESAGRIETLCGHSDKAH